MANKILSFTGSAQSFIDSSLSSDAASMSPKEVFIDISTESQANDKLAESARLPPDLQPCRWKVSKSVNVKAIFNSLNNIFTWHPGERILLPEFGSRIKMLLYEGITPITEERIAAEIRQCVSDWEPRVQIVDIIDVSTIDDTEDNTIHLQVVFTIPALSEVQNFTYDMSYNMSD